MICESLAAVLQSGRAEFNARHEAARQRYPGLDSSAFTKFLLGTVDPLAQGAARIARDRVAEVVTSAYDIGLELVGQKLLGNESRERVIEAALAKIYLPLMPVIVQAPGRILPAIYNALYNLASTPGARPEQWAAELGRLGPQCADPDQLLKLGQVLGWRAGLAHFRQSALATASALPAPLAVAAVGGGPNGQWVGLARRLEIDPWFDPSKSESASDGSQLAVVGRAGAFRGFGGLFVEPPQIASSRDHLWVKSGEGCWLLFADAFGCTFHRATLEEFESARQNPFTPQGFVVKGRKLTWKDRTVDLSTVTEVASSAATATTVAVTSPGSFAITLIARR